MRVRQRQGMARGLLRELAPYLAEEGIDVDNIDVPDLETLQRALARATERRELERTTPVDQAREYVVTTLRLAVEALAADDAAVASAVLGQVVAESPDNTAATVAGCMGVALGLLDEWLSGRDQQAPARLADQARLPGGYWAGERAATDILVLARKGRAFRSMTTLIARQGGEQVLHGCVLALTAAVTAWSAAIGTPVPDLVREIIH